MRLGWQEIMLVMIFALIVFGPKRLPEIGRQIGRAIREVRKVSGEFEREVKSTLALDDDQNRKARQRYQMDEHHSRFITESEDDPPAEQDPPAPTPPPA